MEIALIFTMHVPNSLKIYRAPFNLPVAKARWVLAAATANFTRQLFGIFTRAALFRFFQRALGCRWQIFKLAWFGIIVVGGFVELIGHLFAIRY